jgi:hypothetical protein
MSENDYLWDGAGEPDPSVQKLERTLGALRYQPSPLRFKAPAPRQSTLWRWVALAASLVLVSAGLWLAFSSPESQAPSGKSVAITTLSGTPHIENKTFNHQTQLAQGQWLETNAESTAKITLPNIGQVVVSPNSRVKLVELAEDQQRLELSQGTIEAKVTAPPRLFVIDTPSAKAVDLGCAYTLQVDNTGGSTLHVTSGYVSLEANEKTSIVPAGARCHSRIELGPGTPFFDDAPDSYQAALNRLDMNQGTKEDLLEILRLSQAKDTLTLWHLLPRINASWRSDVLTAIAQFAPLPSTVSEKDILAADKEALNVWRRSLIQFWK